MVLQADRKNIEPLIANIVRIFFILSLSDSGGEPSLGFNIPTTAACIDCSVSRRRAGRSVPKDRRAGDGWSGSHGIESADAAGRGAARRAALR